MDIKYSFVSSRTPWKKYITEQPPSKDGGFDFRLKPTKNTKGIIDLTHLEDGGFNHLEEYKKITLENLQLKSRHISLNNFFPIEASFVLKMNTLKTPIHIKLNSNILFNQEKLRFQNLEAYTNQYHWQGWLETYFAKKDLSA